jgi:Immunoglobulin domain
VAGSQLQLSCHSPAFPPPTYQWLQRLPHDVILVRGEGPDLLLDAATYDDQGEWVCRAANAVGQSESKPLRVTVRGAPQISRLTVHSEVVVKTGEDANLEVEFCANPLPRQAWHLGPLGGGGQLSEAANLVLQSNERHGRFVVDNLLPLAGISGLAESRTTGRQQDCYLAVLRILGAHPADSRSYLLQLENEHGLDSHEIKLMVINTAVSQEIFIAIIVGSILTILIVTLIIVYMVKADKCCSNNRGDDINVKKACVSSVDGPKAGGQLDVGSDRTDVESCHSGSTLSGQTVLPPDALYGTVDKLKKKKKKLPPTTASVAVDVVDNLFNDSREQLRPDILASLSRSGSPATGGSSSYPAGTAAGGHEANVVFTYNELCFPKASNCGSMKRKRDRNLQNQHQYSQYPNNQYPYGQTAYSHNPYSHSQQAMGDSSPAFSYANYMNEDFTAGHAVTNRIYQ